MRNIRGKSGFTLVEILIVVIILGILAAIVIPQFTNASEDARKSSLTSQLQTLRSQIELYKLQHRDQYPTDTGAVNGAWDWSLMTTVTDENGDAYVANTSTTGPFGPYLQSEPKNSLSGKSGMVASDQADLAFKADVAFGDDGGWVITTTGKVYASNKAGTKVYDESQPNAEENTAAAAAD